MMYPHWTQNQQLILDVTFAGVYKEAQSHTVFEGACPLQSEAASSLASRFRTWYEKATPTERLTQIMRYEGITI